MRLIEEYLCTTGGFLVNKKLSPGEILWVVALTKGEGRGSWGLVDRALVTPEVVAIETA